MYKLSGRKMILKLEILYIIYLLPSVMSSEIFTTSHPETKHRSHPESDHDGYIQDVLPIMDPENDFEDFTAVLQQREPTDFVPVFQIEPKDTYVFEDKPANLICKAVNARKIFLRCNNKIIKTTKEIKSIDDRNGQTVLEKHVHITMDLMEKLNVVKLKCECFAHNFKTNSRSSDFTVQLAYIETKMSVHPSSTRVPVGTSTTLQCQPPDALPPPTIRWLRNGEDLNMTTETLKLVKLGFNDTANYTCIAENIAGVRESLARVTVYSTAVWSAWSPWLPCQCGSRGKYRTRTCHTAHTAVDDGDNAMDGACIGANVQRTKDCQEWVKEAVCSSSQVLTSVISVGTAVFVISFVILLIIYLYRKASSASASNPSKPSIFQGVGRRQDMRKNADNYWISFIDKSKI